MTDVVTLTPPACLPTASVATVGAAFHAPDAADSPWWRDAVIYQIYPRSWADSDGDGMGDLPAVTERLDHLVRLGVDAIWLSPFYVSPQADAGYDVADYRDVDARFGGLAAAEAMLDRAHDLGLKVIVDLVPNHSSDRHAWFQAALVAGPGSAERERYMFRAGKGRHGELPPNDWKSVFGGPAWTRVADGQWYLHLFDYHQPDFNWEHPEVRQEFHDILRFWLDRKVNGFRVDVAHGLVKAPGLPDWDEEQVMLGDDEDHPTNLAPFWDQDGVHEIYRSWREILDSYEGPDRIMCAEAWVTPPERAAAYIRPDEFHQAFNFDFLETPWKAPALRSVIETSLEVCDSVGAPSTWVLSNHDVVRHASRLGLSQDERRPNGIGAADPQPDRELGLARARAYTTLMLALPGGAYLYQGEELGLPDSTDLPDELREDPTFVHTDGEQLGRDGCRVPIPWVKDAPAFGFGPSANSWLPQPEVYGSYAVDQQDGVEGSTLELYRSLLQLRRQRRLGLGGLAWVEGLDERLVAFANTGVDGVRTVVVANTSDAPVPLPAGLGEVMIASGSLPEGTLPGNTTVWLG